MSGEPTPVGVHLRAAAEAMAARAATQPRPTAPPVVDDVAALRREGRAEQRLAAWQATIPRRFQPARPEDFTNDVAVQLVQWAASNDGRNLLLAGPVGTGKTHAAIAACWPRHAAGARVRFLPVVELLDLLRPGGPDHAWAELVGCDVLVLDDLGTERGTDWTAERLGALVNRRWLEELPIVVTTNLAPADLEEAVGPRTYSRLVGQATTVRLGGDDRRRRRDG